MFGQGGQAVKKLQKAINGLSSIICNVHKAMEIYCICMFYLNEQTICPTQSVHIIMYTEQNMFIFLMVYVLFTPPPTYNVRSLQHHTTISFTVI